MVDSETEFLEGENEGEIVKNPRFVCEECGFANVRLIDVGTLPAAKCTSCGVGYFQEDT